MAEFGELDSPLEDCRSSEDKSELLDTLFKEPKAKRKASRHCPGAKRILPEWVSDWKLNHAKCVHVFYENDYLDSPKDVLQKVESLQEIDEKQRQYISSLQEFLDFDSNLDEFCHKPGLTKEKLDRLSAKRDSQQELVSHNRAPVSILKGERFIVALHRFYEKIQKQRRTRYRLYEGMFTQLIVTLGEICYLETELCAPGDESIWKNLRGCKHVISKPDCRFYKQGQLMNVNCAAVKPNTVVSVNEVKKAKKFEGLEHPEKKKRRFQRSESSTEESLEEFDSSSSSGISSFSSEHVLETSGEQLPEIITDLNKRVLGQHAGELLLDLHEYGIDDSTQKLTLPGMIVDGTKVYFTLLEMSKTHHEKLSKNDELEETDRATIYYARPLDILSLESRNILIENFVRLNNIY